MQSQSQSYGYSKRIAESDKFRGTELKGGLQTYKFCILSPEKGVPGVHCFTHTEMLPAFPNEGHGAQAVSIPTVLQHTVPTGLLHTVRAQSVTTENHTITILKPDENWTKRQNNPGIRDQINSKYSHFASELPSVGVLLVEIPVKMCYVPSLSTRELCHI